jgi:hypothetical protein
MKVLLSCLHLVASFLDLDLQAMLSHADLHLDTVVAMADLKGREPC